MKDYKKEHELMRRKLWIDVAARVGGSDNCMHEHTMSNFANSALEKFDKKFKQFEDDPCN